MSMILSGVAAVIVMKSSCRSRSAGSATMRAGVNTAEVNSDVLRHGFIVPIGATGKVCLMRR